MSKNALIVGASRGLGLGLVEVLAKRGWQVTATQRKPSAKLEQLAASAESRVRVETVDIDDDEAVEAMREKLASGKTLFDLILVVAGVGPQAHLPLPAVSREVAAQIYLTNAVSPIRFAEAFVGLVAKGGTIGFLSSVLGSVALNNMGGWESYRPSKAALNTNARCFAARHRNDNFGVLLLHPGWVRTDMGGPEADLDVETSVNGMVTVLERRLGAGLKGCVFLDYRGATLPW
jgi:NAD(P)-dependent dehydrogenase (short-subunit alcohol dehydrogenase family)